MNLNIVFLFFEFLLLVFLAGFASAEETAITTITDAQYVKTKKGKNKKDKRITFLIEKKEKIVSCTLIATNFFNMLLSSIVTIFTIEVIGILYLPLTTAITAIFIIIFAEIIPKTIATHNAMAIIKKTSFILYILYVLSYPLVFLFSHLSYLIIAFLRLFYKEEKEKISEEKINEFINISREDGAIINLEEKLLKKAVHLKNIKIRSLMTKTSKIVYVTEGASYKELIETFRKSNFSRLPILSKDKKSFLGLIHYKDVLFSLNTKEDIKGIIKKPIFIAENANVFSVIKVMNSKRRSMVFVIDDEGDILGLLTMDDIVALICGKAKDEYIHIKENVEKEKIVFLDNDDIEIDPAISLSELNEKLGTHFASSYYDSLSGLILEKTEYLPKEGDVIMIDSYKIKIKKLKGAKINSIIMSCSTCKE